jgi:hypothetical protein
MADDLAFDDATIEKLRLAAEEVAWLTGRGYRLEVVGDLVARHHALSEGQRSALAEGTCSEPQYRRRAARELEPEDVARRPLAVDAIDVLAAIDSALSGRAVLQTLDGTAHALGVERASWAPGPHADEAIDRVLALGKELRPQVLRFLIDERAAHGPALGERIGARAKAAKAKVEVVLVPDVRAAMKKEKQVASGDAEVLDACGAWFNLAGRIVEGVPGAKVVRLQ